MHIALLGDSTLDNAPYTKGGPAVVDHLQDRLSEPDRATLLAVDGAITSMVDTQVDQLPDSTTHILLSVGGNDVLKHIALLGNPTSSVKDGLHMMAESVERFDEAYRAALGSVLDAGLPTTVCAIYAGDFDDPSMQRVINVALSMYNNVILQAAMDHMCPVIDLRRVCTEQADFTQQIEPSERGGEKIAAAIYKAYARPESCTVPVGHADRFPLVSD